MKLKYLSVVAIAAGLLAGHAKAQGISSTNYSIPSYVINSGGGTASSTNYTLIASIGEPAIGPASSTNYGLNAGFLATLLTAIGLKGDVNGDGVIDINDVKMMLGIAGGTIGPSSGYNKSNGDVNSDNVINIIDADKTMRYVAHTDTTLP